MAEPGWSSMPNWVCVYTVLNGCGQRAVCHPHTLTSVWRVKLCMCVCGVGWAFSKLLGTIWDVLFCVLWTFLPRTVCVYNMMGSLEFHYCLFIYLKLIYIFRRKKNNNHGLVMQCFYEWINILKEHAFLTEYKDYALAARRTTHTLLQFTVFFHLQISADVCFSLYNNDNMLLEKARLRNKFEERLENWKTVINTTHKQVPHI